MYEIDISCSHPSRSCEMSPLKKALVAALQVEKVSSAVLSVTLVDNKTIHQLNREHLQHDYPTDVISFPLDWSCCDAVLADRLDQADGRSKDAAIEGEIVASIDYAEEMGLRCGWTTQNELTLYVVHGMLHICGYDDLTASEKELMRAREQAILGHLGLEVAYPDDASFDDDEPPGNPSANDDSTGQSEESQRS